jgi:hypothetical protein
MKGQDGAPRPISRRRAMGVVGAGGAAAFFARAFPGIALASVDHQADSVGTFLAEAYTRRSQAATRVTKVHSLASTLIHHSLRTNLTEYEFCTTSAGAGMGRFRLTTPGLISSR